VPPRPQQRPSGLGFEELPSELRSPSGAIAAVPANARLTYRGGVLLPNVQITPIFYGDYWRGAEGTQLSSQIAMFIGAFLSGPMAQVLSEYSTGAFTIGSGAVLPMVFIPRKTHYRTGDPTLRKNLRAWIRNRIVSSPKPNSLYVIFTQPRVVVHAGDSASCKEFCGYHDSYMIDQQDIYYAVMPFPDCQGCLSGSSVLDAITTTLTHEICEAVTDPIPGEGWYDDANGEIGDICSWRERRLPSGGMVQLEWSNSQGQCV
jgi:hypothetical protein